MKKRVYRALFVLALLISVTVVLTACGHEHSYSTWTVEKEATCTKDGRMIRSCECGQEDTAPILSKGHIDGNWVTDTEATCDGNGSKHLACSVCEETIRTESIPATGHTDGEWIIDTEATCTANGSKHQICDVCKATLKTETIATTGTHNYSEKVTTAASCANSGVKTFTCTACNDSYTESFEFKAFSATEIYEMYLNSVGEVITYDKAGKEYALGTCFVYSSDGKVITNYHVIEDAYSAKVLLGGNEYKVSYVLAYDKNIDVAVLKISASNLKAVTLCEKSHKVGEVVYAFGSSKGLTATFSDGMITASDRNIDSVSYTQHDAPISSGNSGGPLINKHGEVIGINTWTVRDSQNLNFAINVSELNKLNYGTALTMAEFYEKECNSFVRLKNYIMQKGTYYDSDGGYYCLKLDVFYSNDNSNEFTRLAYYYVSDNTITLDLVVDEGDYWVYFEIDEDLDGAYYWSYFDKYDYEMSGTLYAASFDNDTLLGYSDNNISSSSIRSSVRELASTMASHICSQIDKDFAEIGVTAADLGFGKY